MNTINIIDIVVTLSIVILAITAIVWGVIADGEKERLRKREPIVAKTLDLVQKIRLERNDIYPQIGKFVSVIGSVRLLDVISEEDISNMIYDKTKELLQEDMK